MRQGELLALKWSDIDFKAGTININKTYKIVKNIDTGKLEGLVNEPKSKNSIRVIPIPKHLSKRLELHQRAQEGIRNKMANLYHHKDLVFSNMYGNYLDGANVLKRFKRILEKNELPEKKFHDLRHTYATRLFELGENPKTVQKLLGHSSLSITLDTYTHVLDDMKEQAVSKIDELYDKWSTEKQ